MDYLLAILPKEGVSIIAEYTDIAVICDLVCENYHVDDLVDTAAIESTTPIKQALNLILANEYVVVIEAFLQIDAKLVFLAYLLRSNLALSATVPVFPPAIGLEGKMPVNHTQNIILPSFRHIMGDTFTGTISIAELIDHYRCTVCGVATLYTDHMWGMCSNCYQEQKKCEYCNIPQALTSAGFALVTVCQNESECCNVRACCIPHHDIRCNACGIEMNAFHHDMRRTLVGQFLSMHGVPSVKEAMLCPTPSYPTREGQLVPMHEILCPDCAEGVPNSESIFARSERHVRREHD